MRDAEENRVERRNGREGEGGTERTDSPACCVKVLARGSDGDCQFLNLRGQSGHSCKRHVVEAIVNFVGQNNDFVLDAQVAYFLELIARVHLADGVVCQTILVHFTGCGFYFKTLGWQSVRGVFKTIILVRGVIAFSSSAKSIVQSAADEVLVAPVSGGCMGT